MGQLTNQENTDLSSCPDMHAASSMTTNPPWRNWGPPDISNLSKQMSTEE
jgi:hypothetical protein